MAKKKSAWQNHLMKTFKDMRSKDSKVMLRDAMKEAAKTFKK